MWRSRIRPFGWLLLFFCIAIAAGSWELYSKHSDVPAAGEVDWFAKESKSYSSVIQSVIPQSNQANFTRGVQAGRQGADLQAAREHFELAIANHAKDNEDLFYGYVIVLLNMEVPSTDIDNAITIWRSSFPQSKRPLLIPYTWYSGLPTENLSEQANQALRGIPNVDIDGVTVDTRSKVIVVPFHQTHINIEAVMQALTDSGFNLPF